MNKNVGQNKADSDGIYGIHEEKEDLSQTNTQNCVFSQVSEAWKVSKIWSEAICQVS